MVLISILSSFVCMVAAASPPCSGELPSIDPISGSGVSPTKFSGFCLPLLAFEWIVVVSFIMFSATGEMIDPVSTTLMPSQANSARGPLCPTANSCSPILFDTGSAPSASIPSTPSSCFVAIVPAGRPLVVQVNPKLVQPVKVKKTSPIVLLPVYLPVTVSPVHVTTLSPTVSNTADVASLSTPENPACSSGFELPNAGYHS